MLVEGMGEEFAKRDADSAGNLGDSAGFRAQGVCFHFPFARFLPIVGAMHAAKDVHTQGDMNR